MADRISELSEQVGVLSDLFALEVFESLSDGAQGELISLHDRLNRELQELVSLVPKFTTGFRVTQ